MATRKSIVDGENRQEKFCNNCKTWKPIDAFYINRRSPDGKDSTCKECRHEYHMSAWAKEGSRLYHINQKRKADGLPPIRRSRKKKPTDGTFEHPTMIDMSGSRFGMLTVIRPVGRYIRKSGNSDILWECKCDCGKIVSTTRRALVTKGQQSCGCMRRRGGAACHNWNGFGEVSGCKFSEIRGGARDRKIPFEITIEFAWNLFQRQQRKCALTGVALVLSEGRGKRSTASLDRIDSSRGYTEDNVHWVHKQLNLMKHTLGLEEFIVVCKSVAKKFEDMKCERSLQEVLDSSDRYLQNHSNEAAGKCSSCTEIVA